MYIIKWDDFIGIYQSIIFSITVLLILIALFLKLILNMNEMYNTNFKYFSIYVCLTKTRHK